MIKAQTPVISYLLVLGIVLTSASAAYFWGVPLLHKGEASSRIEDAKNTINEAKVKARQIIEDAEKEAEKIKTEILEKAKAEIEKEKQQIKSDLSKQISEIESKGKANLQNAVEFLYKEFIGMIEYA